MRYLGAFIYESAIEVAIKISLHFACFGRTLASLKKKEKEYFRVVSDNKGTREPRPDHHANTYTLVLHKCIHIMDKE